MRTFTTLSGPAAALPMINVDTDQLIPKQYLTAISRAGLGKGLFHDFRYDMEDKELPDFVLNRSPGARPASSSRARTSAAGPAASTPPGRSRTSASAA